VLAMQRLRSEGGVMQDVRVVKYKTKGGYSVEVVQLATGDWLRVRHHGFYVADVRTVAELERYFPLSDLEEEALARPDIESTWREIRLQHRALPPVTLSAGPGRA